MSDQLQTREKHLDLYLKDAVFFARRAFAHLEANVTSFMTTDRALGLIAENYSELEQIRQESEKNLGLRGIKPLLSERNGFAGFRAIADLQAIHEDDDRRNGQPAIGHILKTHIVAAIAGFNMEERIFMLTHDNAEDVSRRKKLGINKIEEAFDFFGEQFSNINDPLHPEARLVNIDRWLRQISNPDDLPKGHKTNVQLFKLHKADPIPQLGKLIDRICNIFEDIEDSNFPGRLANQQITPLVRQKLNLPLSEKDQAYLSDLSNKEQTNLKKLIDKIYEENEFDKNDVLNKESLAMSLASSCVEALFSEPDMYKSFGAKKLEAELKKLESMFEVVAHTWQERMNNPNDPFHKECLEKKSMFYVVRGLAQGLLLNHERTKDTYGLKLNLPSGPTLAKRFSSNKKLHKHIAAGQETFEKIVKSPAIFAIESTEISLSV